MTHVITQACCNDGACTVVCPVDCIHPTPAEREYATTEMLYIDPKTCIDCGSCVSQCPVSAIYADYKLPEHLGDYTDVNAAYFVDRTLGPVPRRSVIPEEVSGEAPLRVAVIGSGPSGAYTAEQLLEVAGAGIEVDVFDRLPTPWGLARYGVAPDHLESKSVTQTFEELAQHPRARFLLNVKVGEHISVEELRSHYHAVVFAYGASSSRALGIPGEQLPGSHAATELVAWYNGHPDSEDATFDVTGPRAVIVGNGNVALDVARLLLATPEELHRSDMAPHAIEQLSASGIREVVVVGRRSVLNAACTLPELTALLRIPGVDVDVRQVDLMLGDHEHDLFNHSPSLKLKYDVFRDYAERPLREDHRRVSFRFLESPVRVLGRDQVEGIELERNEAAEENGKWGVRGTGDVSVLETGLVIRSVGYSGVAIEGLPFDEQRTIVPHDHGRVLEPATGQPMTGLYVVGWIKRGPNGVMGTNKQDAKETISSLLSDAMAGALSGVPARRDELDALLQSRQPDLVDWHGWQAIEDHELEHGRTQGRPRTKVTNYDQMLGLARSKEPGVNGGHDD